MRSDSNLFEPGQLFDQSGKRKYLTVEEARRLLDLADQADAETRVLCHFLAFTGCRVSEALALTSAHLDMLGERVVLRTLKRRRTRFRVVPVPPDLLRELGDLARQRRESELIWRCCRQTAWRRIKRLMAEAAIVGPQASPKGFRHLFGIINVEAGIPSATTQYWMGHAKLQNTAIYQHVLGQEERRLAQRLWTQLLRQ